MWKNTGLCCRPRPAHYKRPGQWCRVGVYTGILPTTTYFFRPHFIYSHLNPLLNGLLKKKKKKRAWIKSTATSPRTTGPEELTVLNFSSTRPWPGTEQIRMCWRRPIPACRCHVTKATNFYGKHPTREGWGGQLGVKWKHLSPPTKTCSGGSLFSFHRKTPSNSGPVLILWAAARAFRKTLFSLSPCVRCQFRWLTTSAPAVRHRLSKAKWNETCLVARQHLTSGERLMLIICTFWVRSSASPGSCMFFFFLFFLRAFAFKDEDEPRVEEEDVVTSHFWTGFVYAARNTFLQKSSSCKNGCVFVHRDPAETATPSCKEKKKTKKTTLTHMHKNRAVSAATTTRSEGRSRKPSL